MPAQIILGWFPRLQNDGWAETSPEDPAYNCIAWAGDDSTEKWDPDSTSGRYWPDDVPRDLELNTFMRLYEVEGGYKKCDFDENLEPGFEKIAIYIDLAKQVTHAAKQLPSGEWTSKLGDWEDIRHKNLSSLEGKYYGKVAAFMKRPISSVA